MERVVAQHGQFTIELVFHSKMGNLGLDDFLLNKTRNT